MKNILWILIILFFSGCTLKSVPLPKDGSALLVIPQERILKHCKKGFAFFYTFTVEDSQGEEHYFKITPDTSKNFIVVDNLAAGNYKLVKRQGCLRVKAKTKDNCKSQKTQRITFELKQNSATFLGFVFKTVQEAKKNTRKGANVKARFTKLSKNDLNNYKQKFMILENSENWKLIYLDYFFIRIPQKL